MYTENRGNDALVFSKAFLSNQLARFAPKLYVNLTHQTGRGDEEEDSLDIANYFIDCFYDYQKQIGFNRDEFKNYLTGKVVLEYGPGDILGMALLLYAYGAERVCCVDRFPLSNWSTKNIKVYKHLLNSLNEQERKRAENAFQKKGDPGSGFNENIITYKLTKDGLAGSNSEYDLIISRAVLEHVNDIEKTIIDIGHNLKRGGLSVHKVDLKSHGLDRYTDFDFLTWPETIYKMMYSHKGYPNRWRVNKYKEFINNSHLYVKKMHPTGRIKKENIDIIYSKLCKQFGNISPDELSFTGFWMILEHPNK